MKTSTALLIGSVFANMLVLSTLVLRPAATSEFVRRIFSQTSSSPDTKLSSRAPTIPPRSETQAPTLAPLRTIDWAKLQPADYTTFGAHLAAMGVPPEKVRAFTAVLIHQHYNTLRRAVRPGPDPSEYWRNAHPRQTTEDMVAYRALEREKSKVLRDVLGADFDFDEDSSAKRRRYGDLTPEKITQLNRIFSDYTDLEEQLFVEAPDRNSPEMRARSALLAKEKRADIERLLTAEELLDYDLRNSPASHRLRGKFGAFEATAAEFRTLYPIFQAAAAEEAAAGPPGRGNSAEFRRTRELAERRLNDGIRRVLGESRFAEFQEANDQGLQQTRELVATLKLPSSVLTDVVSIQKEFQPRLNAVEGDRDLTPNQRDNQLGALAIEARNRLIRALGAEGFEAYKRRGGNWLGLGLSRAAPAPPPAP